MRCCSGSVSYRYSPQERMCARISTAQVLHSYGPPPHCLYPVDHPSSAYRAGIVYHAYELALFLRVGHWMGAQRFSSPRMFGARLTPVCRSAAATFRRRFSSYCCCTYILLGFNRDSLATISRRPAGCRSRDEADANGFASSVLLAGFTLLRGCPFCVPGFASKIDAT